MKSDLGIIVIINGHTNEYLEKNMDGFFEKEIIIKAIPGETIVIGESKGFSISYYYSYNVVK